MITNRYLKIITDFCCSNMFILELCFNDLNELGYYIHKSVNRKKKTFSSPLASGIKKNKTRKLSKIKNSFFLCEL